VLGGGLCLGAVRQHVRQYHGTRRRPAPCLGGTPLFTARFRFPPLWTALSPSRSPCTCQLCRFFVESLSQNLGVPPQDTASVRAIFPDAGCAAGLAARWANGAVSFSIASLNDRSICRPDDRVLVVCAPDPQGVEASQRVAEEAASAGAAVVLLNPRLASGDAGIGLNARRLRDRFLGTFTVAYSIRPVADGTVFKAYPEPYKVFGADPQRPGRFKLLSEENSRPSLEDVLLLLDDNARGVSGTGGDGVRQESVLDNLGRTVASMFRFMNSLK
jgi:Domain of unknown function (DUF1995)